MVSTGGGIAIAIVVLLIAAVVGWVVFTQLRARRLGLPPPSLSSYLPWKKPTETPYGPPQPAPGGVVGWFNDQVRKFKNRNNRSAAGAYEPSFGGAAGGNTAGRRGFGPLDPDEAWDARVGHEADSYGYYEEELGGRSNTEYAGGSYGMNLATTGGAAHHDDDVELGHERGRQPASGSRNPFDDSHEDDLRGVSPRPMGDGARPQSSASSERRSVFKENM